MTNTGIVAGRHPSLAGKFGTTSETKVWHHCSACFWLNQLLVHTTKSQNQAPNTPGNIPTSSKYYKTTYVSLFNNIKINHQVSFVHGSCSTLRANRWLVMNLQISVAHPFSAGMMIIVTMGTNMSRWKTNTIALHANSNQYYYITTI